jgi:hypothetical protein
LMPHQQLIADVTHEIDPETGLLAYDEVVIIGPRQVTGKTELLLPVMTYRCTAFDRALAEWSRREFGKTPFEVPDPGPQSVLYTAQTSDEARKKWRRTHVARLDKSPYKRDYHVTLQRNQELIAWRNGSAWSPASTTGKTSGTGDTVDLPVLDEAWAQDFRTEIGLRPTMLTRWWRQMWLTSMIPGLSRAQPGSWPYLKHKREVGRARVEADMRRGMAFFDFAAAPGMDPRDPATWWSCMPGLGRTATVAAVQSDCDAMDPVDFGAEYLGIEPLASAPRWTLIRRETWAGLCDPLSRIEGARAFAVEIAEDRKSACIAVAGRRGDGQWHVEIVEPGLRVASGAAGVEWVEPRLLELVKDWKPCTVVVNPARPAASLIVPLKNRGVDVTTPNLREVAGACGRFFDATGETATPECPQTSWVFHLPQPELERSLAGAMPLDVGEGLFVFVKKGSPGPLIYLNSCVSAMHGVDVKGSTVVPRSKVW